MSKSTLDKVAGAVEKLPKTDKEASNLTEAYSAQPKLDPTTIGKSLLERMPDPTGWRILILPYQGKGKTEGGILLPDQVQEQRYISTQAGYVLKVGPLAYNDTEKFPTGPWCEE
ncbi:MAG: hypothetical protein ACPHGY_11640, partial [Rhodospirillaceae bacterium]